MTDTFVLELTPKDEHEAEKAQAQKMSEYRRQYWQEYKKRHKRVYGTLSEAEYTKLKAIADSNGRAVWEELWLQAKAYQEDKYVPPEFLIRKVEKLYAELRHINNSLNDLRKNGGVIKNAIKPHKIAQQLKRLENEIEVFIQNPYRSKT